MRRSHAVARRSERVHPRTSPVLLVAAILALGVAGCSPTPGDSDAPTDPGGAAAAQAGELAPVYQMDHPGRIPGRYIVRFKSTVQNVDGLTNSIVAEQGGRALQVMRGLKGYWGELPDQAINQLRRNANVAYIEADVAIPVHGVGDTTQFGPPGRLDRIDQWWLPLNSAYEYSARGHGVRIWIIDTGIDRTYWDLAGRIDESWYVTNDGKDPYAPCHSHGTTVAMVAGGAVNGVAKSATFHAARVDADCAGNLSTGAASSAFEFIGDYSPRPAVANYSAGHGCFLGFCGPTVDDAAKYARQRGVTVVVSAGNSNEDACGFTPAHVNELLTVGATGTSDQRESSSNYGSCVDLFAPVSNGFSGTSHAAPLVAGVAALFLQFYPTASPAWVEAEIINKATTGVLSNIGSGSPNRLLYARPPALNASLDGPSLIGPFMACSWGSNRAGGQPPFTIVWRRNGGVVSTTMSYSPTTYTLYSVSSGETSGFDLSVSVTNGLGRTADNDRSIGFDWNNWELYCDM